MEKLKGSAKGEVEGIIGNDWKIMKRNEESESWISNRK